MWIYKITNKVTGKMYIGQTISDVNARWNHHCMPSSSKKNAITAALKTYGRESFTFEVIDTASTIEELNQKEIDYIKRLNTIAPNGYNLEQGGNSYIRHPETGRKISQSKLGHTANTPEVRAKISLGLYKYWADKKAGIVPDDKKKELGSVIRKTAKLEDIVVEEIGEPLHFFAQRHGLTLRQVRTSLSRGFSRLNHEKGGHKKHPLYTKWKSMIQRCYNESGSDYSKVGAKGIRVCWRWLNSFDTFAADMGSCPEGMRLGRRDETKWYTPENCKWMPASTISAKSRPRKSVGLPGAYKRQATWKSKIFHNGKNIALGGHSTAEAAHKAYLTKYKELHGYIPASLNPLKLEV